MLTKDETIGRGGRRTGLLILLVGIAIGLAFDPANWLENRTSEHLVLAASNEAPPGGPFAADGGPPLDLDNGLETLHFTLSAEAVRTLQRTHDRSMERGGIIQSDEDLAPAHVRHGDTDVAAMVRIKGDLLDHIDTDKWSLRVELEDGKILGMSRFSIQHPKTRGFLRGWLVLAAARHDGLLAPRCRFVNVVINDRPNGVYQLVEHFSKELIESQGRREGPIIRLDEDTLWSLRESMTLPEVGRVSTTAPEGTNALRAEVEAFGEKRLTQSDPLNRQLQSAVAKMRDLQRLMVVESTSMRRVPAAIDPRPSTGEAPPPEELAPIDLATRLQAASQLQAETVEEILDVDAFARMTALLSLFAGDHGWTWHNMRFYHDPVRERLEPIVFDVIRGPLLPGQPTLLLWEPTWASVVLRKSARYYLDTVGDLAEHADPAWLEGLMADAGDELRVCEAALRGEGLLPPGESVAALENVLRLRQTALRWSLRPNDAVNFLCHLEQDATPDEPLIGGEIVIEAWGTTRIPVRLDGFRFSNGGFASAAGAWTREAGDGARVDGDAVILPWDGRRVGFRVPVGQRLASLREIRAITAALTEGVEFDRTVKITIDAEYRPVTSGETRSERLHIRRFQDSWTNEGGRPPAPSLREALERHPFLDYDLDAEQLFVRPGLWDVDGDLVVPEGCVLQARSGVQLRFRAGAVLLSTSALDFQGRADDPILLGPAPGAESWSGVMVLDAVGKSTWSHVHVSGASEIQRGGWMGTGGVNFYRCPVEMRYCRFEDAHGEDAVNLFGGDFLLDHCEFRRTFSDAFDGDFVKGTIRSTSFERIGADGLDTSGSRVAVEDCAFSAIGDKAVSAGEVSDLTVRGGSVRGASIGVAAKDGSRVDVEGLVIEEIVNYALTAYIKKPEYTSGSITARGVRFDGSGRGDVLVQTGCQVLIDGVEQTTQDLDVKALYQQKILGQ